MKGNKNDDQGRPALEVQGNPDVQEGRAKRACTVIVFRRNEVKALCFLSVLSLVHQFHEKSTIENTYEINRASVYERLNSIKISLCFSDYNLLVVLESINRAKRQDSIRC